MKTYCEYILASNPRGVLYIGVTGELQRRIIQHKLKKYDGFTKKYHVNKLVYVEPYECAYDALTREKKLKQWLRAWKIALIEEHNPEWKDLYELYYGPFILEQYEEMINE